MIVTKPTIAKAGIAIRNPITNFSIIFFCGEFFLWIYLRNSAGSAEAKNTARWFCRLSESFFMNLSENICGICRSKKYRPLISQIIGEFYYEFIWEFLRDLRKRKILPADFADYRRVFYEFIWEYLRDLRKQKILLVDFAKLSESFIMNLSAKICGICGSKKYRPLILQILGDFFYEFIWEFLRDLRRSGGAKIIARWFRKLSESFFMNLSENFCGICGICGSNKYRPLISQILGDFCYDFICGSNKYCSLILQIIGEFLYEFICEICGSK